MIGISLAEAGRVPDFAVRMAIRRLIKGRLAEFSCLDPEAALQRAEAFREELFSGSIALDVESANEQHYEVAPEFFERVLGAQLKYSCGLWDDGVDKLDASEERMLAVSCERAGLEDGMRVLDLGCGWGSLSLWIAEHYPNSRVLAVSNSKLQREHILSRCARLGLGQVEVITADVNEFEPDRHFDRVISIEMFEHVRNHRLLLSRIARWLEPGGKLFVHHFAHREHVYPFEVRADDDWMARYFFTGGIMPSDDHLLHCQEDLVVERRWRVSGKHYQRTSDAWLERQDSQRDAVMEVMASVYGNAEAKRWFYRWRLFFMACSELFGFRNGNEWWVSHVLMHRPELGR